MSHPLQLRLLPGYEVTSSHHPTKMPVLIEIEASASHTSGASSRPPITLGLCIDNSGSMDGEPLALVKRAVSLVLEQLQPGDRVGLVSFSSQARVWQQPQFLDRRCRRVLTESLEQIVPECATAMYDGLLTTLQQMPALRPDELSHVWLLTDGYPNEGPWSPQELCGMTREWRRNCVVSTFGFGAQHNEDLLREIAKAGGGSYTYIESVQAISTAFALSLGSLFGTVAKDVRLLIRPSEFCQVERISGDNELRYTARGIELPLSDWVVGQSLSLLMDVTLTPDSKWSSTLNVGDFVLEYFMPEQETQVADTQTFEMHTAPEVPKTLQHRVATEQLLLHTADVWLQARQFADAGRFVEAMEVLEPAKRALEQHRDWHDEISAVRDWYEQFVEELDLYIQRPDRQWYQDFRKQAVAEMQMPGQAMGAAAPAACLAASPMQQAMIQQFRRDDCTDGVLDVWEQDQFVQTLPVQREMTIGRVRGNDLVLPKGNVSKRHARIVTTNEGCVLVDLRSSNGLYLNGHKLHGPTKLTEGDTIYIGDFRLAYRQQQSSS